MRGRESEKEHLNDRERESERERGRTKERVYDRERETKRMRERRCSYRKILIVVFFDVPIHTYLYVIY